MLSSGVSFRRLWIVGGGAIAEGLRAKFQREYRVFQIGRSPACDLVVDFQDIHATSKAFESALAQSHPDGIVFCQRFRPSPATLGGLVVNDVQTSFAVEVAPLLMMADLLARRDVRHHISCVHLGSLAGTQSQMDVPFLYSGLKAMALSLTPVIAGCLREARVSWNAIVLNEYLKGPEENYSVDRLQQLRNVASRTVIKKNPSAADIADFVATLLSPMSHHLTGNNLLFDGGAGLISAQSFIRNSSPG